MIDLYRQIISKYIEIHFIFDILLFSWILFVISELYSILEVINYVIIYQRLVHTPVLFSLLSKWTFGKLPLENIKKIVKTWHFSKTMAKNEKNNTIFGTCFEKRVMFLAIFSYSIILRVSSPIPIHLVVVVCHSHCFLLLYASTRLFTWSTYGESGSPRIWRRFRYKLLLTWRLGPREAEDKHIMVGNFA